MQWTIGDKLPEAPRQFTTGDLVIYGLNGSIYLLGRQTTNSAGDKLFDYWMWSTSSKKASRGLDGSFASKHFSLFQGSITLFN